MGVGQKGTWQESCDANATPLFAVRLVFEAVPAIHRQHVITEDVALARVLGPSVSVFKSDSVSREVRCCFVFLFSHICLMPKEVLRLQAVGVVDVFSCHCVYVCQTFVHECFVWQKVSTGGRVRDPGSLFVFGVHPESGQKSLVLGHHAMELRESLLDVIS